MNLVIHWLFELWQRWNVRIPD